MPKRKSKSLSLNFDLVIDLIKEELKIYRIFGILREAGFCDCHLEPHLEHIILKSIGRDGSDETSEQYFRIFEKRSKNLKTENERIKKQAIKVYHELLKI